MGIEEVLHLLVPWEFSPTLLVLFLLSAVLFWRGSRVMTISIWRPILFWSGWLLLYLSMHTQLDYYAERVFYIHRIQHVILHHLSPLMIMASYPGQVMMRGMPFTIRYRFRSLKHTLLGKCLIGLMTNKVLVPFLFVFLVLVWLIPKVQFYAMLDWQLYRLMNWSVVLTGFMYWNLILDRRPSIPRKITAKHPIGRFFQRFVLGGHPAVMSVTERILSPIFTMLPQLIVGIWIVLTTTNLYPLFELCGRAVNISSMDDQRLGAFILWVPAALVETFGLVVALMNYLSLSSKGRLARANRAKED
ncbi:cytochrome c oxidase assembly protein [Basilea psittacipulmonis]|uniref:cytochrome c oxidase assembly protein n=1 Tax=Basilea psittacipulmonis TaxID=1472345 RepID=UPI000A4DBD00|nr:cytochrome c oxidase assembly protein [Basilea psittacipulmonis]